MNKIIKLNGEYVCIPENGSQFPCTRWYEKKTDEWYIKLPKNNPTGREYIREKKFIGEELQFETKTTGPRVLGTTNWRSRLTPEETKELEEAEKTIERLKEIGMSRKPLTEEEKLRKELEEMRKKFEELLAQRS